MPVIAPVLADVVCVLENKFGNLFHQSFFLSSQVARELQRRVVEVQDLVVGGDQLQVEA